MDNQKLQEFGQKYRMYLELKAEIEAYEKELKESIVAKLADSNEKELVLEGVKFTYKKPSVRRSFDSKKFQEEEPLMYEKYLKETQVKGTYVPTIVPID